MISLVIMVELKSVLSWNDQRKGWFISQVEVLGDTYKCYVLENRKRDALLLVDQRNKRALAEMFFFCVLLTSRGKRDKEEEGVVFWGFFFLYRLKEYHLMGV